MMRPEDLWDYYPKLFHITWGDSWASIKKHGLLSIKALLCLSDKSNEEVVKLTRGRRKCWVEVELPERSRAVLRDQKPMTDTGLRRALPDSVALWRWYELINSMVFFWARKECLEKMLLAKAYQGVTHDVLVIDTRRLVRLEEPKVRLSHMNSGSTNRAHLRDMNLFKRIEDYPFKERRRRRGKEKAVAEVCVVDRVEKIGEALIDVKHGSADKIMADLEAC